jgi:hypothetical protein
VSVSCPQTFKDVISVDLATASNLDSSANKKRLNRGFAFVRFSSHGVSLHSLFCARKFVFGNRIIQCIPWQKSWPDNFVLSYMTYLKIARVFLNFELSCCLVKVHINELLAIPYRLENICNFYNFLSSKFTYSWQYPCRLIYLAGLDQYYCLLF